MTRVNDFFQDYNAVKTPGIVDKSFLNGVIYSADAVSRTTGHGVYVLDYTTRQVVYVSPNIAKWCNISSGSGNMSVFDCYLEFISEDDLQMLMEINKIAFEFWKGMPDEECMRFVISYDFKFGETMVNQHYSPIVVKDGNVMMAICVLSPSSNKKSGNIIMRHPDSEYEYTYSLEHKEWRKLAKIHLTQREKEIIRLSVQGSSAADIAADNHTSEQTVKTQKRNLCRKLGVKNMVEAARLIMNNDLL